MYTLLNKCFNSIFRLFYMFRTSYIHDQEDHLYVVGSKSFRPDQLFKVTEIKQLGYFST